MTGRPRGAPLPDAPLDPAGDPSVETAPGRGRSRTARRRLLLLAVAAVALVVLVAVWLAVRGAVAARHLTSAQAGLADARTALLLGRGDEARADLDRARADARAARGETGDVVWRAVGALPGVGQPVRVTTQVARAVDRLATDVLPPLVEAGQTLSGGRLLSAPGTVDLGVLRAAAPGLQRSEQLVAGTAREVAAIPRSTGLGPVDRARDRLQVQVDGLRQEVHAASVIATTGPDLLGGSGRRTYFVAFQNNAEARATGGILGAYGVLQADAGRLRFTELGSDTALRQDLPPATPPSPEVPARSPSSGSTSIWQNANISADLPYAASVWAQLWQEQSGTRVDSVIATDPVALSYLLAATSPVRLANGDVVTAANAVRLTLSDVYARFANTDQRKSYLQQVSKATSDAVLAAPADRSVLVFLALKRATAEGRLRLWSARAPEQAQLETTGASGALPPAGSPVSLLALNNTTGTKLDYYVSTRTAYTARSCDGPTRPVGVDLDVTNGAPATGLPPYVLLRGGPDGGGPATTAVYDLVYYATAGAQVRGATLDGAGTTVQRSTERGLAVVRTRLAVPAGATVRLHLDLTEPVLPGAVATRPQPLVQPQQVVVRAPVC